VLLSHDFKFCFATTNVLFVYTCTEVWRLLEILKNLKICVIQVGSRTAREILENYCIRISFFKHEGILVRHVMQKVTTPERAIFKFQ
jgi:hypothetical protein